MLPESGETSFQTKAALRGMLKEAGLRPRKRLGQNFLIDRNLMRKLIDAADLEASDCVLEVGAGMGSLTSMLARRAGRVVAVEIDRDLARLAERHLSRFGNVHLVIADVLESKSALAPVVCSAVRTAAATSGGLLKLVANLPYDIATPLIINILLAEMPVRRLCFSIQAEVADRLLAAPGTGAYGPVSVITQVLASGRRICRVSPQAFWPAPKVDSAIVRLDVHPASALPISDPAAFAGFVRSFFQHRRKTIAHTARHLDAAGGLVAAIARAGLEAGARPENLGIRDWVALYDAGR